MSIAAKHGLKVITDSAQAPGTWTKVGKQELLQMLVVLVLIIISTSILVRGILVTHDYEIYERLQLIRNHGEAVIGDETKRHHKYNWL